MNKLRFLLLFNVLAIVLGFIFLNSDQKAFAISWWDTNYAYRKNIKITSSNAIIPLGGTLTTTIDTKALIDAGKMREDGKDLRLIYTGSGSNTELDYTTTLPSTRLLTTINNSATTIYIDDGNALPASGKVQIDNEVISYTSISQTAASTASSSNAGNVGPDSNINDGNIDTTIHNTFGDDASGWYQLDFPSSMTFNHVRFKEAAYGDGWISAYTVQYWDGSAWQAVSNATTTPTPPADGTDATWYKATFDSVSATKIRIAVTQGGGAHFSGLYELEVFNLPSITNIARPVWQLNGVSRGADSTTASSHTSGVTVQQGLVTSTSTTVTFKAQSRIDVSDSNANYYWYYGYASESTSHAANTSNMYLYANEFTSSSLDASLTLASATGLPTTENNAYSNYYHINLPAGSTFDYIAPGTHDEVTLYHASPFLDWTMETSIDTFGNIYKHAGVAISFGKSAYDTYLWGVYCNSGTCKIQLENANGTTEILTTAFSSAYGISAHTNLRVRKISDTYYFDYRLNNNSSFTNLGSMKTCCGTINNDYGIDPVNIGLFSKDFAITKQIDDSYFDYLYIATNVPTANYTVTLGTERAQADSGTVSTSNSTITTTNPIIVKGNDTKATITLTLKDTYGDPVSSKQITFTSSRSGDSFSTTTGTTDVNGQITTNVTSTTAGTSSITATDSDGNVVTASSLITVQTIEPIGFNFYNYLYRLPYLDANLQTLHASSVDPDQINGDVSNYLYLDSNSEYVIFDEKGPGVVYRAWMTTARGNEAAMGNLKFYLDGSSTPTLNTDMSTFFGGSYQNFAFPITADRYNSAGGFYSFLPIIFATSMKITTTNLPDYYNITYQKLPAGTALTSYTTSDSNTKMLNLFNASGLDPKPTTGNTTLSGSTALSNGSTATIASLSGNGSIQSIKLTFSPKTQTVLNNTYLQMYWDGEGTPSVNIPIGYFFGAGEGTTRIKSLFNGYDDYNDQFYIYFPMPYKSSAVIKLQNSSGVNITTASYTIDYKSSVYENIGKQAAYFKANYVSDTPTTGNDLIALNVTGRGRIVAFMNHQGGASTGQEGNERVYINGNGSPQINGTGTEDFFNAGWGFEGLNFLKPLNGNPSGSFASSPVTMYNIMLGHSFNYENGIKFQMQHGATDNITIPYNSVTYYYGIADPGISLSDTLNIGDTTSEASHTYSDTSETSNSSVTSSYPGSDTSSVTDSGRAFTGYSQFTVNISSSNLGVILRRRFDYSVANQTATVAVDGATVGTWYDAGSNSITKWKDSNFWIPESFTSGKSSITVKITNTGSNPWNEYYYWAYSINNLLLTTTSTTTSSSSTTSTTSVNTPSCSQQQPGAKAPWLYAALPQSNNSIMLYFTDAQDPYDHYVLKYGLKPGQYQYAADNIGSKGTRTYLVKSLSPNTTYYFQVRGGNGCATGDWSNEISATTKSNSIGRSSLTIVSNEITVQEKAASNNSCVIYTVKPGDSLWGIAVKTLKSGLRYEEIIKNNIETYPSLKNSNVVSSGWELKISCEEKSKTESNTPINPNGYNIKVKVKDAQNKPIEGAVVTLHSNPKTAVTNKDGLADFKDVEPGNHKVIISYDEYKGEQAINVGGSAQDINITIKVEKEYKNLYKELGLGIFVSLAISGGIYLYKRRKYKNTPLMIAKIN